MRVMAAWTVAMGLWAGGDACAQGAHAAQAAPTAPVMSILENARVLERTAGTLYVQGANAQFSRAIPLPTEPGELARCVDGGTPEDVDVSAIITVRYDPKNNVPPRIMVLKKPEVELLSGVTVFDKGPDVVYVTLADGAQRAFRLGAASPEAWTAAVRGGTREDVRPGTRLNVRFDPTGREPLTFEIVEVGPGRKGRSGGCGCHMRRGDEAPAGFIASLAGVVMGAWVIARRREMR